ELCPRHGTALVDVIPEVSRAYGLTGVRRLIHSPPLTRRGGTRMTQPPLPDGVEITAPVGDAAARIVSAEACAFVADLVRQFRPRVHDLLAQRVRRHARFHAGEPPRFLDETRAF